MLILTFAPKESGNFVFSRKYPARTHSGECRAAHFFRCAFTHVWRLCQTAFFCAHLRIAPPDDDGFCRRECGAKSPDLNQKNLSGRRTPPKQRSCGRSKSVGVSIKCPISSSPSMLYIRRRLFSAVAARLKNLSGFRQCGQSLLLCATRYFKRCKKFLDFRKRISPEILQGHF